MKKNKGRLPKATAGAKAYRRNLITLLGMLAVWGYLMFPANKAWLTNRIVLYFRNLPLQLRVDDVEQRLRKRHQYNYEIMKRLSLAVPDSVPLLLPPRNYVKQFFSGLVVNWFHSSWNYYFFGPRKVAHYIPNANIDWQQYKMAVIITNDKKPTIPEKGILLKRASPLMVDVINEHGEKVGLYLVSIESAEILNIVIKEYSAIGEESVENLKMKEKAETEE
jgi:hypothetical protein